MCVQVTDVTRTWLSVGRTCDTGREVVFRKTGGFIKHIHSGKKFAFKCEAGAYIMEVDVVEAKVFSGPE